MIVIISIVQLSIFWRGDQRKPKKVIAWKKSRKYFTHKKIATQKRLDTELWVRDEILETKRSSNKLYKNKSYDSLYYQK